MNECRNHEGLKPTEGQLLTHRQLKCNGREKRTHQKGLKETTFKKRTHILQLTRSVYVCTYVCVCVCIDRIHIKGVVGTGYD